MSALVLPVEPGARRRWMIAFAVMAALHLAPALVAIWWLGPIDLSSAPAPSAIMIDMTPLQPPAPAPVAPPPRPPMLHKAPELHKAPKPAVALPRSEPHPPVRGEEPPPDASPAPQTPSPATAPPAATPAAPAPPSNAEPTWRGLLLGRLEQFKRYPALAQSRRQQGVAYLRFVMDRDGKVLDARIEKSSGYASLDDETLALLERAQPLPKPPPEVAGNTVELVVPIEYFFRGRG